MNSRWKSTLAAFGAAGLTIAIAPFAVAEPVADEAPADQTTATAPAVTQEPAPVAPAPSTSNTAPTPTQSAPATTPSESSAPSSTASEAEGASSAATSASETSAEESESEAPESTRDDDAADLEDPENEVLLLGNDWDEIGGASWQEGLIVDDQPPAGVDVSELVPPSNERVYVLANPDWFSEEEQIWWDYDHPSGYPLYLSPEGVGVSYRCS